MKLSAPGPVKTDIVLVGAGHAHVQVLQAFGMASPSGLRLTIITDRLQAPYSGMLPGCIADDYTPDDIHIDIARLARATGTRLIHASATGIDRQNKRILLRNRPPIAYDIASFNIGITPDMASINGAAEHAVPVKPIAGILERLHRAEMAVRRFPRAARLAVIGGGAAGIELALALNDRNNALSQHGVEITLIAGGGLAPLLNAGAQKRTARALAAAGITVIDRDRAVAIEPGAVICASGRRLAIDVPFVSTHAKLPEWLTRTDLPKAANGGIAIAQTLQVMGDDSLFAAGDCATMTEDPRPRAGVFAVRQGAVLGGNLLAAAHGAALKPYKPQKDYLSILRTGHGQAIASRGRFFAVEGQWVWRLKDRIDQAFMERFRVPEVTPDPDETDMRCGGCAAKVGPVPLAQALARLDPLPPNHDILVGLGAPDDAAVVRWSKNADLITSVDQFRAFIDDAYLFGRIAANHALNDIFAMGGVPHHALALAVLPFGTSAKTSEALFQLLSGARATLDAANTPLVGGHSSEGETLALGFSVSGRPGPAMLTKRGARPGDRLILTKAIGSGIVFAADMRAMARSGAVESMVASMLISNAQAVPILAAAGARSATDVSGFGLAGHLGEMLGDALGASIPWEAIPLSKDVMALAEKGFTSSLLPENRAQAVALLLDQAVSTARMAVLFDPQTAGGLLASVPPGEAAACVQRLRSAGYPDAADIGSVTAQRGLSLG
ncbi:MAG: selenide, water dikinase SelD [Beijerinckiaceae bacterium]